MPCYVAFSHHKTLMFAAFIPGPDILDGWSCKIVSSYQEACDLADEYFKQSGIVVAVEELPHTPLRS